jgi:threonine/homoserine/homoserine lactone efflux protein
MLEDIEAAIPLGFFLSFMIGPVFFVLLETSALKGFRAAIVFDLGVILADILFLILAYFSSRQLLENLSNRPGLFVLGGVILVVYGITIFVKKETKKQAKQVEVETNNVSKGYLGLFIKGFLLNFINIGVLAFWLVAIITAGTSLDNNPKRILTFFTAMILAYFATDVLKILLAKQLKRKLTSERIHFIKKGLGIILIICGIVFIIKGFLPKDRFNIEQGIEKIEQIRE